MADNKELDGIEKVYQEIINAPDDESWHEHFSIEDQDDFRFLVKPLIEYAQRETEKKWYWLKQAEERANSHIKGKKFFS